MLITTRPRSAPAGKSSHREIPTAAEPRQIEIVRGLQMRLTTALVTILLALAMAGGAAAGETPGKPSRHGDRGFAEEGMHNHLRPGDDFFRFANGDWLDHAIIPADRSETSMLQSMTDQTDERLRGLLEQVSATAPQHEPATTAGKVGAFYRSFLDEARIDTKGFAPISAQLAALRAANGRAALAALMGRDHIDFESSLWELNIDVDQRNPRRYAGYLSPSGWGLPSRDYYLGRKFAATKTAYQAYLVTLLRLVRWTHPTVSARHVLAFETRLARTSWSGLQQRDPVASYMPVDPKRLGRQYPGFPWSSFLLAERWPDKAPLVMTENSAAQRIARLYGRSSIATIKAWQAAHIADNAAIYLSRPFQQAYFHFHGRVLAGQQQARPRWQQAVHAVSGGDCPDNRFDCFGNLGWAVGQLYEEKYFPASSAVRIEQMIASLETAFRRRIETLDWMDASTKREALRKLTAYTVKIGGPARPRSYDALLIRDDDLVGNVLRTAVADWDLQLDRLQHTVDPTVWLETPQTVDANNGPMRDIEFPAALLQPPLFDPAADAAVNYGAIGAFIGHELTHGFDDEGRHIDAAGYLREWWTPGDVRAFQMRSGTLARQYGSFEPLPGFHVDGELTLGENIADLGGLNIALDAYHASLQGRPAPLIDGLSGDQRLFLSWARLWRGKTTDEAIRQQAASEVHAPYAFRVNGPLRNIDAWYRAFNVGRGDRLYLPPQERVRLW